MCWCCKIVLFVTILWSTQADEIGNTSEVTEAKAEVKYDGSISFMGNYGRSSRKEDILMVEKEWQIALAEVPEETLFVAGLPDNSDECFSRFANVIVADNHPYMRNNNTPLAECKQKCMQLHQQFEACASFVYDNVKMECDIFTQRGDVAPSWYSCLSPVWTNSIVGLLISNRETTLSQISELAATSRIDFIRHLAPLKAKIPFFLLEFDIDGKNDKSFNNPQSTTSELMKGCTECESGKVGRFTRIEGYELFESNDEMIEGATAEECMEQCDADKIGESPLACRSFDYNQGNCAFSSEQAFPVGNGRLKRNTDAAYYEKLCMDERLARNCNEVFDRFPQMVLVGYAETVTDAPNFEMCIERCIDSIDVYGYNCTSGMYYFEEKQLNCILNAENRMTKEALFADEFEEIVDYFEISCGERRIGLQI